MAVTGDLAETWFIDHGDPAVARFAAEATAGADGERAAAAAIFAAVRDEIRYDPYTVLLDREVFRAGAIAGGAPTFCVPKALLMVAACRAVGIPARIGMADVRNHLSSPRLLELMGTDLFRYHGYASVQLDGRWLKASPAFNAELCERFGVAPLDFDGTEDALLHAYTGDGRRHMEYVEDHGTFDDLPYDEMIRIYTESYPTLVSASRGAGGDAAFGPGAGRS